MSKFAHFPALVNAEAAHLEKLAEPLVSEPRPGRTWSRKQELGHLIDSAANNHVRFARGAFEPTFAGPSYNPDAWVEVHQYSRKDWRDLVAFWKQYNLFLGGLIASIPEAKLATHCVIGGSPAVTLGFVIDDYIVHLRHHVDQILDRENVTPYPQRP